MKKNFSKKKSAFSLIELSIVLIIIGLLIAGITGGASLIRSSELRAAMGEARGYSVAVNAFFTQFNAYPGDFNTPVGSVTSPTFSSGQLVVGNGNSRIEFCGAGCASGDYVGSENAIAWQHLKFAGAIDVAPTFVSGVTANQTYGTHFPASKIKSAGWVFDYNTANNQNVVVLTGAMTAAASAAGNSVVNGSAISTAALTPTDALSIDIKIDDGIANAGKVRAVSTTLNSANIFKCINSTPASGYNITEQTKVCALQFQVDINS